MVKLLRSPKKLELDINVAKNGQFHVLAYMANSNSAANCKFSGLICKSSAGPQYLPLWYSEYFTESTSAQLYCFLPCDAIRCTVSVIVILSVRPSVCHICGLCPHGLTYDHDFFTTG